MGWPSLTPLSSNASSTPRRKDVEKVKEKERL